MTDVFILFFCTCIYLDHLLILQVEINYIVRFKNEMKIHTLYFSVEFQNLPDPEKWHLHSLF